MPKKKRRAIAKKLPKKVLVSGALNQRIPKFCNAINFAKTNNNIILTFIFTEPNGENVAIERITIDDDHAKKIIDILQKLSS